MVLYTCEKCKKDFNKKCDFIRHTELKKKPCVKLDELITQNVSIGGKITQNVSIGGKNIKNSNLKTNNLESTELYKDVNILNICEYCNREFKRVFNLKRHLNTCFVKKDITYTLQKKVEELKIKDYENEQLKMENTILKNDQKIKDIEIEKLKNEKITNNGTIINNNIINNNNIQINIVNYGKEDLSKLDMEKILTYDNSFIEMVFRDINCNPKIPENQNILLPSLSRYDIYIKLNNEWLKRNKTEILKERYFTIREYIMELYMEESNINKKKADKMYFHFLKQIKLVDPTTAIYKPQEEKKIIEGISNVLYNHKDNIKSIIKKSIMPKNTIMF